MKKLFSLVMALMVLLSCNTAVFAAEDANTGEVESDLSLYALSSEVFDGSPYNATIYTFWKGWCENNEGKDFLAYRVSQNLYTIIFADDIVYSGGTFSGSGTYFTIDTSSSMGSSSYDIAKGTDSFVITPNDKIVFTNVTNEYPSIDSIKEVNYGQITSISVIALLCLTVLRWIFIGK